MRCGMCRQYCDFSFGVRNKNIKQQKQRNSPCPQIIYNPLESIPKKEYLTEQKIKTWKVNKHTNIFAGVYPHSFPFLIESDDAFNVNL